MNEIISARQGESNRDLSVRDSDDGTYEVYQSRRSSEYTNYRDNSVIEADDTSSEQRVKQIARTGTKSCCDIGWLLNLSERVGHS